jgi:hypothetical protein
MTGRYIDFGSSNTNIDIGLNTFSVVISAGKDKLMGVYSAYTTGSWRFASIDRE